jgi:hypothetical protein
VSSSPPLSFWYFIGFAALAHVFVPLFLRGLRVQFPACFVYLGQPNYTTVFSRNPDHWKLQLWLLWCVLSGRAWGQTSGGVGALAGMVWLAYVGIFASLGVLVWDAISSLVVGV